MSAPETLRDALLARLVIHDPDECECLLPDDIDGIIYAARAESDALRAALELLVDATGLLLSASETPLHDGWQMAPDWTAAHFACQVARAALAPSPAEPAAPGRCPECGVTLSESHFMVTGHRPPRRSPAAPDPAAPDRCAFQRDGLEPCLLDRDNPRHTGCAHNPPRFLHGQQMACHDFRPAAPEREP